MSNRFADDAVNARAAGESVRAVEMLHLVQGNLTGGGGGGDRSVGQRASLAQGEDTRWQAGFTHGNCDEIPGVSREAQKTHAFVDASRFGRDFDGIDRAVGGQVYAARQIRGALEVVDGEQDARGHRIFANGLAGKFAQGFDFEIAPVAAGFAGLSKPVEFTIHAPGKLATAFAAAASGEKCGVAWLALAQPAKEAGTLGVTA